MGTQKKFFLTEGASLVIFGAVAVLLPPLAGLAAVILLGWLLMATGLMSLITTLRDRHAPGFWWALPSAVVTLVTGLMLFAWPLGGLISLSAALGLFLLLDGFLAMGLALEHRRHLAPKWIWLMGNGVADLIFAACIFLWLPSSAGWALSLFIGADMMISGLTLIGLGADMEEGRGAGLLKDNSLAPRPQSPAR